MTEAIEKLGLCIKEAFSVGYPLKTFNFGIVDVDPTLVDPKDLPRGELIQKDFRLEEEGTCTNQWLCPIIVNVRRANKRPDGTIADKFADNEFSKRVHAGLALWRSRIRSGEYDFDAWVGEIEWEQFDTGEQFGVSAQFDLRFSEIKKEFQL